MSAGKNGPCRDFAGFNPTATAKVKKLFTELYGIQFIKTLQNVAMFLPIVSIVHVIFTSQNLCATHFFLQGTGVKMNYKEDEHFTKRTIWKRMSE